MNTSNKTVAAPDLLRVKFWEGMEADVNVNDVASRVLPVKGVTCARPLRFLEIYSDSAARRSSAQGRDAAGIRRLEEVRAHYFPRLGSSPLELGPHLSQPPFSWSDADARKLCVSFTYNANAFFRIFDNLAKEGKIDARDVDNLVDRSCVLLAEIYQSGDFFVIQHINNNWNMYLISKVVETIAGKAVYCCEEQEFAMTSRALQKVIGLVPAVAGLPLEEKMGVALAMGVAFVEQGMRTRDDLKVTGGPVEKQAFSLLGQPPAIDDRARLVQLIADSGARNAPFVLAAVLDDATESAFDLFWMDELMMLFPYLKVNLLVNTAQISINFSWKMLALVFEAPCFKSLASRVGRQLLLTKTYCPFISFQTAYLPDRARAAIDSADIVYIKGANFFETCQIPEKNSFHAFIVYGPVSRSYTGLQDHDAVFAYLPEGTPGYVHHREPAKIETLRDIVTRRDQQI